MVWGPGGRKRGKKQKTAIQVITNKTEEVLLIMKTKYRGKARRRQEEKKN